MEQMNLPDVNDIIRYESGEMSEGEALRMFAALIKSGTAWNLQGSYGRSAVALIDHGWITEDGDLTEQAEECIAFEEAEEVNA